MKFVVLLLFLVGALAPTSEGNCGVSPISRVIGGVDAKPGNWPWQIALLRGGGFICGGSLIKPDWVVTAAHCVAGSSNPASYQVRVGEHNRNVNEGTEQTIAVKRIIAHSQYNRPVRINNDIALIQLARPATLNSRVTTVCLPSHDFDVPTSSRCFITGWGKIRHPGSSHHILQQAQMPPVKKDVCAKKLAASPGGSSLQITDQMLCAGVEGTILSGCHGDSGGPYVCQNAAGRWVLQGAVSWGSPRCSSKERFTVFARVSKFRNWIDQQTGAPPATPPPPSGDCPNGWLSYGSQCYKFVVSGKSWDDARADCLSQTADLVSIHSDSENKFIKSNMPSASSRFWIGFNDKSKEGAFEWSDKSRVTYVNWNSGEPNNSGGEDCGEIHASSSKWNDMPCRATLSYICKKSKGSPPPPATFNCNFDANLCGFTQSRNDKFDWTRRSGGTPSTNTGPSADHSGKGSYIYIETSSPRVQGDNAKLSRTISLTGSSCLSFYYHMYGSSMGSLRVTVGGQQVFSKSGDQGNKWSRFQAPLSGSGNKVLEFEGVRGTSWRGDIAIDDVSVSACGGPPPPPPAPPATPPPPSGDCPNGWLSYGSQCYKFVVSGKSWDDARADCLSQTADLVSIHSDSENKFIKSNMPSASSRFWIGFNDKSKEGAFEWSDKSRVTYVNWNSGEPNNSGGEDCGEIHASSSKWNDMPCRATLSYICKKSKGCPNGWLRYGSQCYKFVMSKKNWDNARADCLSQNGDLVSIHSDSENKFMKSNMPSGSSRFWIGFNDKRKEGAFEWSDKSSVTYNNWNSGEPNDYGRGEDCGEIHASSSKWNDMPCTTALSYICKRSKGAGTLPPPTPAPPTAPPPPPGSCGVRPNTRIVGGVAAKHGDWPWQAMLRTSSGFPYCGGTLVAPQWVVTATHCVQGKSPSSVFIRLGAHKRTSQVGTEQDFKVTKVITHPSYHKPKRYSHDIALLKLEKPAQLNRYVNLACLPQAVAAPGDGVKCWITGWGRLASGGSTPNILQQVSVPVTSHARCEKSYPGKIHDSMICAGLDQGGIDSCQGDSGGPMVCETGGRYYLHGVTSWGYGCASAGKFGVYAKVKYTLNWLNSEMSKN